MTISLGNALKSVNADEKWVKKVLIGGFVSIAVLAASFVMQYESFSLPIKLVGLALYLIIGGLLSGFLVSSANKQINENTNTLTEWTEPNILLKGIKFLLSYLVYGIVITILGTIVGTVIFILIGIVLGIIYYLLYLALHLDPQLGSIVLGLIFGIFAVIFMLYFLQYCNAAFVCYYKNLRFHDFMALKRQLIIITENQHASWTLIGKTILYALLFLLVVIVACITVVGILLLPFIYFAAYIVILNLYVQYARKIDVGKYLV